MKAQLRAWVQGVSVWARAHRRLLLILALMALFFTVLGHFAKPINAPGMCKIYG